MNKLAILAAAALIGSAGLATAQETLATADAFGIIPVQDSNNVIEIPLVTATADGEVQIRRIAGTNEGEVLGSIPVTAGANENVRITLLTPPNADSVLAVLVEGGADVAEQEIEMSPPGNPGGDGDGGDGDGQADN
ncbi:hypothetical protein [Rubellimicrobium roseum]|uniref:Uncharacterized protein n=1 Tax=Rubellimicrobium roseum TaxID=687525 RepID=A0A5C4NK19_9RHOB|nr:hypothetical protein [Rubellimicrobium roseum]TNC73017.1 hypothetical protein FHG71_06895 [Rubellimicrobium roseum]